MTKELSERNSSASSETAEPVAGATWLRTYWPHLFGTVVALVVGVPAAVASYRHGITVVATHSTDPAMAPWLPMTTDGLLLASLVALWARRMTGRSIGVGPWAAFGLGLGATLATNAGAAKLTAWGLGVALWPPLCLAIVLELVALIVVPDRGQTRPTAGETTGQTGQTETKTAVDQPKLSDEQIVAIIRAEGIEPARKALADRFGMGSTKADRIRGLVESPVRLVKTGQTDDREEA